MARPDVNSSKVRDAHYDEVFPWLKEVSAEHIDFNLPNQRWVETPEGYIHSLYLQPCKNLPNSPLLSMPDGQPGFWGEVTVPYVDLVMDNPAPVSGWMQDHVAYGIQPRLYYSQVMWIDNIRKTDAGSIQYHVKERYGNPGDLFWADGAGFRPLTSDDISPIHAEIDPATKKIVVNVKLPNLNMHGRGPGSLFLPGLNGNPGRLNTGRRSSNMAEVDLRPHGSQRAGVKL